MRLSATYVCPVRGLAGLEPPEPFRLGKAAKVAKSLGPDRLLLPVLEESLAGTARAKTRFLDGLIYALDQISDAGFSVGPQRLSWVGNHRVGPETLPRSWRPEKNRSGKGWKGPSG